MLRAAVIASLVAPVHVFLAQQTVQRLPCVTSCGPRALAALRARVPLALADTDSAGYYRLLGIGEDATYDEITDSYMDLLEAYKGDDARLAALEDAKEKVLALMLRKRMEGSMAAQYGGQQAREDRPPPPTTPIWEIVNDFRKKTLELPKPMYALRVVGLLGGLTLATWLAPNTAGTILLLNTVSAMGFMYNRGEPDVPRDDFGQIGEIRPMKPKPMMLTVGITTATWIAGFVRAKQVVALMGAAAPRGLELLLRTTFISLGLIVPCLLVKVQPLFADDY